MSDWVTVKQLASEFPFSEASIRYHIFHSKTNGLDQSIRRIGRKILISRNGFKQWIENGGKA